MLLYTVPVLKKYSTAMDGKVCLKIRLIGGLRPEPACQDIQDSSQGAGG